MEAFNISTALLRLLPMLLVFLIGSPFIAYLRRQTMGQFIREDGPQSHHVKAGTPTAGGVIILAGLVLGVACIGYFKGPLFLTDEVWITLAATLVLGGLGFLDDYQKIKKRHNKGVTGYTKLAVQTLVGLGVGWYVISAYHITSISVFHWFRLDLGWLYPLFAVFVITGVSNAVNLTDGLDGLAASTSILSFLALSLLFTGSLFGDVAAVYPDLAFVCEAMIGSLLGFLIYNLYPAKLFMGDTGSLAIGGALGTMAVLSGTEFWLIPIGIIFVAETLSVILQVGSFKLTGKRIFKMAPLHHHFEQLGWRETKVVIVFALVQLVGCALALDLYNPTSYLLKWGHHLFGFIP